jgi:hypothetical protein
MRAKGSVIITLFERRWSFPYASRAFAAYYAIQASIAAVSAHKTGQNLKAVLFGFIALIAALATVFGTAVE